MGYLTLIIAMGIVLLFGYWSGRRRINGQSKQKSQGPKVSSASRGERQTKLRRIK